MILHQLNSGFSRERGSGIQRKTTGNASAHRESFQHVVDGWNTFQQLKARLVERSLCQP